MTHSHRVRRRSRPRGAGLQRLAFVAVFGAVGLGGTVLVGSFVDEVIHGVPAGAGQSDAPNTGGQAPGTRDTAQNTAPQKNAQRSSAPPNGAQRNGGGQGAGAQRLVRPKTGQPVRVGTPEGFAYTLAGVSGGTRGDIGLAKGAAPGGALYAYAEYILTNTGQQPALLDFPAELYVKRSSVPLAARSRCSPQPGTAPGLCAPPSRSEVVGGLGNAKPLVKDGTGATYIPVGASYLVRTVMDAPVAGDVPQEEIGLYIASVRFTGDRIARAVPFPA